MASLTLAAIVTTLSAVLRPFADQVVLTPRLPPVDQQRTGVISPIFRADAEAAHAGPGPVQTARRVQLSEQDPVQLVEHPGMLPALQYSPADVSRAEPPAQEAVLIAALDGDGEGRTLPFRMSMAV
ncbi:hypothetical protein ACWGBU_40335 [Streptomyces vinaceus]